MTSKSTECRLFDLEDSDYTVVATGCMLDAARLAGRVEWTCPRGALICPAATPSLAPAHYNRLLTIDLRPDVWLNAGDQLLSSARREARSAASTSRRALITTRIHHQLDKCADASFRDKLSRS